MNELEELNQSLEQKIRSLICDYFPELCEVDNEDLYSLIYAISKLLEDDKKQSGGRMARVWGEFSDSEDWDLVSDYWKEKIKQALKGG